MSQKLSPLITAEVILKSASDQSLANEKGKSTAENTKAMALPLQTAEEAARRLEALGFEVLQCSRTAINIAAPAEVYERAFRTRIVGRREAMKESGLADLVEDVAWHCHRTEPGHSTSRSTTLSSLFRLAASARRKDISMQASDPVSTVPDMLFERIWKIFTELSEAERHFNALQSQYRTLASTWLLGTFAAMGFVMSEKLMVSFPREVIVGAFAIAGTIGIYLLWTLDIMVYHRLLDVCFTEGLKIEKKYDWLPPVRTNMMKVHHNKGILSRVVWFYLACNAILILIAGITFSLWTQKYGEKICLLTAVGFLLLDVFLSIHIYRQTSNTAALQLRIAEQDS
jgi:hypothetical protein